MALNDQDQQTDHVGSPASPVGELLQATRVRVGADLRDIADLLCIRYPYLLAIEEGRFQDLPGAAYATGFVRTYAEHLGLDGEEVIRRYRAETDGLRHRARLAFPIPVSEERVPTGAMVLVGMALFGIAYGFWYWQSISERPVEELIPEIPARLMAMVTGDPKVPPSSDKAPESAVPAQSTEPSSPVEGGGAMETPRDAQTHATPEVVTPPSSESETSDELEVLPAQVVASAPPIPAPPAVPVPIPTPPASPVPTPPAPLAEVAPAPVAPPAATPPAPRVYGDQGAASRVVLRINGDAWVQIRDGKTTLLTRMMHKGDTYRVPAKPGLVMLAGNAGEIDVLVDGVAAPALGPKGMVRRNVSLDPDSLRAGPDAAGASPALPSPADKPKDPAAAGN